MRKLCQKKKGAYFNYFHEFLKIMNPPCINNDMSDQYSLPENICKNKRRIRYQETATFIANCKMKSHEKLFKHLQNL